MKKFAPLLLAVTLIFSSFLNVQAKTSNKKNIKPNKKVSISISKKTNFNTNKKPSSNSKNKSIKKTVPKKSKSTSASTPINSSKTLSPVISINSKIDSSDSKNDISNIKTTKQDANQDISNSIKPITPVNNINTDTKLIDNNQKSEQTSNEKVSTPVQIPNQTVLTPTPQNKFTISSNDMKFYNTKYKEFVALPVTYTTYKNSDSFIPKYTTNKNNNTLEVIIDNSTLTSSYSKSFDSMKRNISIESLDTNKTKISITTSDTSDVEVYRVSNKPKVSGNSILNRDFIVFSFFDKGIQSEISSIEQKDRTTISESELIKLRNKFIITIDPGHGGKDSGACAAGMKEKNLALDISLKTRDLLSNAGYDVYMTRETDKYIDLYERATVSNILKSDLFMSIHINANGKSTYNGTTVLYNSKSKNPTQKLAETMRDSIADAIGTNKLRLEDRPKLVVLNSTNSPSILIETAVLSNPSDAKKLADKNYLQLVANTIFNTLEEHFGFQPVVPSQN